MGGWRGAGLAACALALLLNDAVELGSRGRSYEVALAFSYASPGWLPNSANFFSGKTTLCDKVDDSWDFWRENFSICMATMLGYKAVTYLADRFICDPKNSFSQLQAQKTRAVVVLLLSLLFAWKIFGVGVVVLAFLVFSTFAVVHLTLLFASVDGFSERVQRVFRLSGLVFLWAINVTLLFKWAYIERHVERLGIYVWLVAKTTDLHPLLRPFSSTVKGIIQFHFFRSIEYGTITLLSNTHRTAFDGTNQNIPDWVCFLQFNFYAPLVWQGPNLSYTAFVHEIKTRYKRNPHKNVYETRSIDAKLAGIYFARLLGFFFLVEVLTHNWFTSFFFYRNKYLHMRGGETYAMTIVLTFLTHIRTVVTWTFFQLWACLDLITIPDNFPRFIVANRNVTDMWRSTNASVHQWILRNIYTPIQEIANLGQTILTALTFIFMAVWHRFSHGWILFYLANFLFVITESWFVKYPNLGRLTSAFVWACKIHVLIFFWLNIKAPIGDQMSLKVPLAVFQRFIFGDSTLSWNDFPFPSFVFYRILSAWVLIWFALDDSGAFSNFKQEEPEIVRNDGERKLHSASPGEYTNEEHRKRRDKAAASIKDIRSECKTICDVLRFRSSTPADAERIALVWLDKRGKEVQDFTFQELYYDAIRLAETLVQKFKVKPGDRVVLVYPPGLPFVVALFACMYAKAIAVPVYPPTQQNVSKDHVFQNVLEDCKPVLILTDTSYRMYMSWKTIAMEAGQKILLGASIFIPILASFVLNRIRFFSTDRRWIDAEYLTYDEVLDSKGYREPLNVAIGFTIVVFSMALFCVQARLGRQCVVAGEERLASSAIPWYRSTTLVSVIFPQATHHFNSRIRRPFRSWFVKILGPPSFCAPAISERDIAYLQYTSGSTADPKGVRISHANLMHQGEVNQISFGCLGAGETAVNWCPQYHDLGLVVCILSGIFAGIRLVSFSPMDFLRNPLLWIEAISKYRAQFSAAPNFAYGYVARKAKLELLSTVAAPKRLRNIDLTCWKVAGNGGEPVRYETLQIFLNQFSCYGFSCEAFFPCFGLAEHTILVSGRQAYRSPTYLVLDANELCMSNRVMLCDEDFQDKSIAVGCGEPFPEVDVKIVDPDTHRVVGGEDQVGEILISSPSVAAGYWGRCLEENNAIFKSVVSDLPGRTYLRTGDLGFLHAGELFICGRLKDLIIIDGKNHYPQDIESCAESCGTTIFRPGSSAAIVDPGRTVALVLELRKEIASHPKVDFLVREACGRAYCRLLDEQKIGLSKIVVVKAGLLPKTSSGKIKRKLIAETLAKNDLEHGTIVSFCGSEISRLAALPAGNLNEESPFVGEDLLEDPHFCNLLLAIFNANLGGTRLFKSIHDLTSQSNRNGLLHQPVAVLLQSNLERGVFDAELAESAGAFTSLEAVQFANMLGKSLTREGLHIDIPIDIVMRFHTIGQLAAHLYHSPHST